MNRPKFNDLDIIQANYTKNLHFSTRTIIGIDRKLGIYTTMFHEDNSKVDSPINIIDSLYDLAV